MVRARLILAEVSHSMSFNSTKMEVPQLWVKSNFPLNVREAINVVSCQLMTVIMQKEAGC